MPLRLYNTLTRQKGDFAPIDPANVRLYACGPTVYDHLHIGNGRMLVVFDVLFRLLRHIYGADRVTYVRNITDIDDKINARAAERGVDIRVLTDEMTKVFHEDAKALGCLAPTVEPRATNHIAEMISMIEKLIAKGHAYLAEGHVLFDVPSMPAYGKLSKRPLDEMIAGARVEVAPYKRGPMDFVLWKSSSASEPGWESPWGRGRPGWHIECSAMSWKHLGEVFDIHGGGIDLLFPHHENEMAQNCSAFGHDIMANVWMHNGHLQVEGEKMAKSAGNFVTIRDLWASEKFGGRQWNTGIIRLAMLMTHYREPIDWTVNRCSEAEAIIDKWIEPMDLLEHWDFNPEPSVEVVEALSDDLDTTATVTALHGLAKEAYGNLEVAKVLAKSLLFLGIIPRVAPIKYDQIAAGFLEKVKKYRKHASGMMLSKIIGLNLDIDRINSFMERRLEARTAKNWAEADRIRDELSSMGVVPEDNKDGTTTWEVSDERDSERRRSSQTAER